LKTDDPKYDLTIWCLWLSGIGQLFESVRNVTAGALRGYKSTKSPLILATICIWLIGMPLQYVISFPLGGGIWGIFGGRSGALAVNCVLMAMWWHWKTRRLTKLKGGGDTKLTDNWRTFSMDIFGTSTTDEAPLLTEEEENLEQTNEELVVTSSDEYPSDVPGSLFSLSHKPD